MRTKRFSLHRLEFSFERNFPPRKKWKTVQLTRRETSPNRWGSEEDSLEVPGILGPCWWGLAGDTGFLGGMNILADP